MKDDLVFNVKFIELVKNRPCLYDYYRTEYKNKKNQDAAWLEIATIIDESVAECKEKWKNLRGCYTRHLKNSRIGGKCVRPYYLAEDLKFLNGLTKQRTHYGSRKILDTSKQSQNQVEDREAREEVPSASDIPNCNEIRTVRNKNTIIKSVAKADITKTFKIDATSSKTNYSKDEILKNKTLQDPDLAFFYSLLPDMKEMTTEQKRRFKMGVISLASNILKDSIVLVTQPHSNQEQTKQESDSSD